MDLWRVLYGPATAGDIDAIDRFLRVEARIASLLGLDRPVGGETNGAVKIVLDQSEDERMEGRRPASPPRCRSPSGCWTSGRGRSAPASRSAGRPRPPGHRDHG